MLTSDSPFECEAKLADFGLALTLNQVFSAKRKGTIGYAAPELLNQEQSYGTAADIWSLGVMLHVMLTK